MVYYRDERIEFFEGQLPDFCKGWPPERPLVVKLLYYQLAKAGISLPTERPTDPVVWLFNEYAKLVEPEELPDEENPLRWVKMRIDRR